MSQIYYIRTNDPGKQIRVPVDESEKITIEGPVALVEDFKYSNPLEASVNREVRALAAENGLRVYKIGKVAMRAVQA